MGIGVLWSDVRYHADMGGGLVGGYVVSVDGKQCVCFFDFLPTLHESSEFFAGRLTPGRSVLAVDASGEEVADTCFYAGGWVYDRVFKVVGQ